MARLVIAIFGPTASGKTAVAEAVARLVHGEVVSCDSMQAYRGLPVLTCQPATPTRLVGIWPLDHEGSVGEYAGLAHAAIDEVLADGPDAGRRGRHRPLPARRARRARPAAGAAARAHGRAGRSSTTATRQRRARRLEALDPEAAAVVHANDRRRVVRALELAESGESLVPADDRLWAGETRHPTLLVGLEVPEDVAAPADRAANRGDVRRRRPGGGPRRTCRPVSLTAAQGARARGGRDAPARGRPRRDRAPHAPVRRLPAQVDATHTGPRYGQRGSPRGRGRR